MSLLGTLPRIGTIFFITLVMARAQSQFGSIAGTVNDPSGTGVPGATVRATNEATNGGFFTVAGESGDYLIGGLLPGVYTIAGEKAGFKDFRLTGIVVGAGKVTRADLGLSLGSTQETITVSANAVQLNTESGTVAPSAMAQYIDRPATIMPSGQTLADTLVPYLPGQTFIGGRAVTAYGSRTYDRRVAVDGAVFGIAATSGVRMPRGSVDELQSTSLTADAQHQTANTTEMFTAKGTNDFHGAVWTEVQNAALNALNWYAASPKRPPGLPTVGMGFILGGPVYIPKLYNGRNKSFFHITFQRYNFNLPGVSSATLPTAAMRSGNLSEQNTAIVDPLSGLPFPNAAIPPSRISPISQKIMDQYMPPVASGTGFSQFNYNVLTLYNQPYHDIFLRGDQQLGSKDNVSFSYGYNHSLINQPNSIPPNAGQNMILTTFNFLNASANHIFSPSLLNEINFGARMGVSNSTTNTAIGQDVLAAVGLTVAPGTPAGVSGGPTFTIAGLSAPNFGSTSTADQRIYTFRDTLSWTHGRSTIKAGFEFVQRSISGESFANLFGTYNFSGLFSKTGFGDFLLGLPSQTSRNLPPGPIGQSQHQLGYFVTQDFRATKSLTLNLGLRVQYNSAPVEPTGQYYNFDPSTGNLVVPTQDSLNKLNPGLAPALRARIVTAATAGFPGHLANAQLAFNPRFGFAYQLGSNSVVRGGYGIYGTLLGNGGSTGGPFTPGVQNFTNVNNCEGSVCAPAFTLSNPFPTAGFLGVSGIGVTGINPSLRVPQMHQWNLTGERRLPGDIVFRATYAGSKSTNLTYRRNINLPPPSTIPYSQNRLTYPQWFSAVYADSGGNASYHSLDTEIRRQWRNGLTLNGGYSVSKCITDDDEGGLELNFGSYGPLGVTIENPYSRARDRGNCESIPRHSFRTMYVYDLPFGKNRTFLNNPKGLGGGLVNSIVGGWSMSGFLMARSGSYFTPLWTGFDAANTGQTLIRADRICSGVPEQRTSTAIFDKACFTQPQAGQYGNAGTGIIEGLGYWNYDAGLYKYFTFGKERAPKLRIGMTSLNIFNHPAKGNSGTSPFIINSSATVARANDTVYNSGVTANLGQWRQIYFEGRLQW